MTKKDLLDAAKTQEKLALTREERSIMKALELQPMVLHNAEFRSVCIKLASNLENFSEELNELVSDAELLNDEPDMAEDEGLSERKIEEDCEQLEKLEALFSVFIKTLRRCGNL